MKRILVVGSLNMDCVYHVPHMPEEGETVLATDLSMIPGGKGANQAYAAGKLGGAVSMLGAVGKDEKGEALLENLSSVGVDVSRILRLDNVSTGTAFISVNDRGNNSIAVVQGANALVTPEYLRENRALFEASDIIVLQLEIPLESVVCAAKLGRELGKTVILDPAPARGDLPPEIFPCLTLIKPNEVELRTVAGNPQADKELEESCRRLEKMGVENVLVTLGGEGSYLWEKGGTVTVIPADQGVKVVDTTAAGDSFNAAVALCLARGESLPEAAAFAARVSDIVVSRPGAQTSIPTAQEVERTVVSR